MRMNLMTRVVVTIAACLLTVSILNLDAAPAQAGCGIRVKASNSSNTYIQFDTSKSKVKVKNGTWAKVFWSTLGVSDTRCPYQPNITRSQPYNKACMMDMGCNVKRRWRFKIKQGGQSTWIYVPSATGWTTRKTVNLGDLSRRFSMQLIDDGEDASRTQLAALVDDAPSPSEAPRRESLPAPRQVGQCAPTRSDMLEPALS